jgi:hypothetical protein
MICYIKRNKNLTTDMGQKNTSGKTISFFYVYFQSVNQHVYGNFKKKREGCCPDVWYLFSCWLTAYSLSNEKENKDKI